MSNKKDNKNSSLTLKISIITAIIVVWVICLALVLSKCESDKEKNTVNPSEHEYQEEIITYDATPSGKVTKEESKTLAYFNSHFTGDYYRVKEIEVSSLQDGTYYTTEIFAYSTQGYVYRESFQTTYDDIEYSASTAELLTPTNAYIIYHDMQTYFNSEGDSSIYKNNINFTNDVFTTGTINIRGKDYYYEEFTSANGISVKYCFDENDRLLYNVSSNANGTITEQYIEYTNDVDYSIFQIPDDYRLEG
ncbi:MAG: hypothetical protein UH854_03170 [Clostridia bacterium]|nr:hypothetical protein [Clostridia bacterium]